MTHLEEALKNHDIKVFFQPIVRTLTCKACAAEALVRWDDSKYGHLLPSIFIKPLEATQLITKLDLYVAEEVCRLYQDLQLRPDVNLPISINFSRSDFQHCNIRRELDRLRAQYHVPDHALCVEVTERDFCDDVSFLKDQLTELRDHGYEVWMDDFGSGFSSLSLLKDLDVDLVKFDLRFLVGSAHINRGNFIIGALIAMVKQLGMKTLVEGVETEAQLDYLQSVGCERMQGYLYSRPIPFEQLVNLAIWDTDETEPNCRYYNAVGCCNMVQAIPESVFHGKDERLVLPSLPACIVEYQAGKMSLLETNAAFTAREGQLAFRDPAAFDEYMGQAGTFCRRNLLQAIKQCQDTQKGLTIEVSSHNEVCSLRIDPIAKNEASGAEAFLIILTGVRTSSFKERKAAVQSIMNGIFSLFDSFFVLNLTTQTVHRIKVGMNVTDEIERLPLPLFLREWARRHVFSEDWKRFLQFYDLSTLVTRINESGCGYLSTFFRVTSSEQENRNGWQLHLVWLSGEPSDIKVYCGTVNLRYFMGAEMPRPMEPLLVRNKLVPFSKIDKDAAMLPEVLWEAMLHLPEMNVYWKDVKGRFMGANDAFMHYFNLSSLDDILGKSEEELGWNVEFDPTYREEEMLLGQIPVISEEKVHCMAKGMIRTVMMNKIPLIEAGRIVGSLSWFRDVTRFTQIQAELKKKSTIDALTGALNYQGFKETQSHFVDSYQKWDLDFILIYMDLDDFKHCNDTYGHGFGDLVLQEVVKRLQKIFNHYGVVARVGGDEFIALLPIVESEEIRRIKQEIQQVLKAPLSIDGRSYQGGISVGIARYSEREDMDALQELADQRMYEDKKKRKKMQGLTYGYLVTTEGI
ncbi:EAL domain-containing protein [uncultured Acidaminococcus sp.]|uniref:EAL domain-containing protein n=1 Tax=uncultured Acidaminococcus sp. TaxID=352152 RepID=UPI002674A236|nr:EAL domain-containing protein [uncultured Acidaminococcus sp.]